jgi:hypothetical protein
MLTNLGVLVGAGATHLHDSSAYVRAFERPSGPLGRSASAWIIDEVSLVDVGATGGAQHGGVGVERKHLDLLCVAAADHLPGLARSGDPPGPRSRGRGPRGSARSRAGGHRAAEPPVLLPWPRRWPVSFPDRDAGQPPPLATHVVPSIGFLLPHAMPTASLVCLHPTSHCRSASSACSPLHAASLLLPTPCRRSGSSSPGAAVLLNARAGSYRSDTRMRESSQGRAARPRLPYFWSSVTEVAGDQNIEVIRG